MAIVVHGAIALVTTLHGPVRLAAACSGTACQFSFKLPPTKPIVRLTGGFTVTLVVPGGESQLTTVALTL